MSLFHETRHFHAGKVTLATLASTALVVTTTFFAYFEFGIQKANAANVQTSVTVLNVPPVWTVDAQEATESSTTTPTNAGTTLSFTATGTDSNGDNYYLLICKTSGSPTANSGAAPTCNGGISNQWAVSSVTTSGQVATAATTTKESFPFNAESNNWWGFICDAASANPSCNIASKQGSGTTVSPFVINHPPIFSVVGNNSPTIPGGSITWTTTATDTDLIRGGDTIKLLVCKAADYANGACGVGGTWASSTLVSFNPSTTTNIAIPTQDKVYNAYVYVVDQSNLVATSTLQGSNSPFTINNVAPSVSPALLSLVDPATSTNDIILTRPYATSGPYEVRFTATDNNGCLNASSGAEVVSATTSIYRSGIGDGACHTSGQFDTNSCYPSANTQTLITCSQDGGSCSGSSDPTSTWTCRFSLWYNADPTDTGTQYPTETWRAAVQVTDDNSVLSTMATSSVGTEVDSFLAFNVTQTAIAYGGFQPGQSSTISSTTDLIAQGNVGIDENLYGDTMCTTWTSADSCDSGGFDASKQIPVSYQKFATSSLAYTANGTYNLTSSSSPSLLGIRVQKTTATSSPQTKITYWGIQIPIAITQSGAYQGQNTIMAVKSAAAYW